MLCHLTLSSVTGGKLGFFYKDHEILPPLPGNKNYIFLSFLSLLLLEDTLVLTQYCSCIKAGFHRYILENFSTRSLDNIKEREVEEFDPPSEVCIHGKFAFCLPLPTLELSGFNDSSPPSFRYVLSSKASFYQ